MKYDFQKDFLKGLRSSISRQSFGYVRQSCNKDSVVRMYQLYSLMIDRRGFNNQNLDPILLLVLISISAVFLKQNHHMFVIELQ